LLGQQFFNNPRYAKYLTSKYVLYYADSATEEGQRVFQEYDVNATPQVMVALADGRVVDRIIGYDGDPEVFKQTIEGVVESEKNLLNLELAYEKDPGNMALAVTLAREYGLRYVFTKMHAFSEIVQQHKPEAELYMVPFGKDDAEVSAFEYARYLRSYIGYDEVLEFIEEFPGSALREYVFENLGWYLANSFEKEEILAIYYALLEQYPGDPTLLTSLILHYEQADAGQEKGVQHARELHRDHPEVFTPSLNKSFAVLLITTGAEGDAARIYGEEFGRSLLTGDDYVAMNEWAWFWALKEKYLETALAVARTAVEGDPTGSKWDTLSMVYWKLDRYREAITAEEEGMKLDSDNRDKYQKRIDEIRADMKG